MQKPTEKSLKQLYLYVQVRFPEIYLALLFVECYSVLLKNVGVMESYGYGLMGWNMMEVKLNSCQFYHNYWRIQDSNFNHTLPEIKVGGNAFFLYNKKDGNLHIHRTSALLFSTQSLLMEKPVCKSSF